MLTKRLIKGLANAMGLEIQRISTPSRAPVRDWGSIPDLEYYQPLFSPWHARGLGEFRRHLELAGPFTLISPDRLHVLYSLARQAKKLDGHWYECGVYRGGSAMMLAQVLATGRGGTSLHLFDTFEGMPETDARRDLHKEGDFSDTSLEAVRARVTPLAPSPGLVRFHKGFIPATFAGLEGHRIAFAHVDVDIYQSVIDCCEFIYPRITEGGFMVFDDYGFPTCPGARSAVDEFFRDKSEVPLVLTTGQAIVYKSFEN